MNDLSERFNEARRAQKDFEDHARNTFDTVAKIREIISGAINAKEALQNEITRLTSERDSVAKALDSDKAKVTQDLEQFKKEELSRVETEIGTHRDSIKREIEKSQTALVQIREAVERAQAKKDVTLTTLLDEFNKEKARLDADLVVLKQRFQQHIGSYEQQAEAAKAAALHAESELEDKKKAVAHHENQVARLRDVIKSVTATVS